MPEATPLMTAPPSKRFFTRARAGPLSSASPFKPPSLHVMTVTAMVAKMTALKRPQDSLRTRPRSVLSLMRLMVGFRAICPKSAPPNHVARPRLWAILAVLDGSGTALAPLVYPGATYVPVAYPGQTILAQTFRLLRCSVFHARRLR